MTYNTWYLKPDVWHLICIIYFFVGTCIAVKHIKYYDWLHYLLFFGLVGTRKPYEEDHYLLSKWMNHNGVLEQPLALSMSANNWNLFLQSAKSHQWNVRNWQVGLSQGTGETLYAPISSCRCIFSPHWHCRKIQHMGDHLTFWGVPKNIEEGKVPRY